MISDKIRYFIPKVFNRLAIEKNRTWKYCDINRISMCGFKPFSTGDSFKRHLKKMLGAYDEYILVGISDEDEKTIITSAEQALCHEFSLLGSGIVTLNPIDWHSDFKNGKRWDKRFYRDLGFIQGADIKMPWELSRCQHLLWLGEAYLLTKQDKYAQEIVDEINWWIDDNPFMYSVNWTCAMDVAFRAVNWMFALNMIACFPGYDEDFCNKVEKSFWQHGFFVRNNLEKQIPYSNNHYASDIVGLLYIGALFANTNKGKKWYRFALKEYYREVNVQVFESGVHYERSVSYHRLMTELFSYPVYMLKRIGEQVPQYIIERIAKMYKYTASYTKPNGLAPLIADNDDGRFIPLLKRDFRKHDYLNNAVSVENRFVALGSLPIFYASFRDSKIYDDAGVAVVRQGRDYLFINHGGYSKKTKETDILIGTHTHNDLLSFELSFAGEDILVDAGTYLYTSAKEDRDAFRGTAKHNTIVVDGEEQNVMVSPFELKRNVIKGKLKKVDDRTIEGDYTTIEGKMYHCRRFQFSEGHLIIKDTIKKEKAGHEARIYFHFAEGVKPVSDGASMIVEGLNITFSRTPDKVEIVDDTLSPSYGVLTKNTTGVASFIFDDQLELITTISRRNND